MLYDRSTVDDHIFNFLWFVRMKSEEHKLNMVLHFEMVLKKNICDFS